MPTECSKQITGNVIEKTAESRGGVGNGIFKIAAGIAGIIGYRCLTVHTLSNTANAALHLVISCHRSINSSNFTQKLALLATIASLYSVFLFFFVLLFFHFACNHIAIASLRNVWALRRCSQATNRIGQRSRAWLCPAVSGNQSVWSTPLGQGSNLLNYIYHLPTAFQYNQIYIYTY